MRKAPMVFNNETKLRYDSENSCILCDLDFSDSVESSEQKVRHHCHFTGEYLGAAHSKCNILARRTKHFPVLCHNMSKYDLHLFIKNLNDVDGDIDIIPHNKEVFISVTKNINLGGNHSFKIRFLDSFRFMPSSLEKLVKTLDEDSIFITKEVFKNNHQVLFRKGVFPYDYLDSFKKLEEEKLPDISKFFNKLTNSECSPEDYKFANTVWEKFECKNLKDYLEIYLKCDIVLLADIFEKFRRTCIKTYKLDPCHYFTAPGLSWDAMLKMTGVELELMKDINMYNFIQRGIRGGLTQCSIKHCIANNKYLNKFESSNESNFLMYYDANNLYGYAMSQPLPYKNFKFLSENEILNFTDDFIKKLEVHSEIGYILEVDLDYPEQIHDIHLDYPFCPENKLTPNSRIKKLIADVNHKHNYIIHFRMLQECLNNGLKLKKIHNILEFNQSCWLKKYISLNTDMRSKSSSEFEKNFYKLMNNSVYGKTMENVEKRRNIFISTHWENISNKRGARSLIAHPSFHSSTILDENFVIIEHEKSKLVLNKPTYIGFTVLDISKLRMYDFYYNYLKKKFQSNIRLVYTDTDSFIISVETHDFYADIKSDILKTGAEAIFDTSDYPEENIYNYPLNNKKVIGLMKDENNGLPMKEVICLQPKTYYFTVEGRSSTCKAKGVPKCISSQFSLMDYKSCLYNKSIVIRSMYIIQSKVHNLYTLNVNKIALNFKDDKRYILSDNINTLPWGHYRIEVEKNLNEDLDIFKDIDLSYS